MSASEDRAAPQPARLLRPDHDRLDPAATRLRDDRLADRAAAYFHMEPVIVEIVDPELIGGLQIQVGDTLYDLSLKSRLEQIKQQLLARSSHEIQRRRDRIGETRTIRRQPKRSALRRTPAIPLT